jgi:hypothetical protein
MDTPTAVKAATYAPTAVPTLTATVIPTIRPTAIPPTATPAQPVLLFEEYKTGLVSKGLDPLQYEEMGKTVLTKRARWRMQDLNARLEYFNQALAKFNYKFIRVAGNWDWNADLMRGNDILVKNGRPPWSGVKVSASGSDFAMVMENTPNVRPFGLLVRKGSLEAWDTSKHAYLNDVAWLGEELLTLDADIGRPDKIPYSVKLDSKVIYQGDAPPAGVDILIKALVSYQNHWALEVAEQVIVDGISIGPQLGFQKVFGLHIIRGQPFYFFQKDGKIGVSYAGNNLPQTYDEVIHYKCCEPALFNPNANDHMVWFWAVKGGDYYYIEAGVYE